MQLEREREREKRIGRAREREKERENPIYSYRAEAKRHLLRILVPSPVQKQTHTSVQVCMQAAVVIAVLPIALDEEGRNKQRKSYNITSYYRAIPILHGLAIS